MAEGTPADIAIDFKDDGFVRGMENESDNCWKTENLQFLEAECFGTDLNKRLKVPVL